MTTTHSEVERAQRSQRRSHGVPNNEHGQRGLLLQQGQQRARQLRAHARVVVVDVETEVHLRRSRKQRGRRGHAGVAREHEKTEGASAGVVLGFKGFRVHVAGRGRALACTPPASYGRLLYYRAKRSVVKEAQLRRSAKGCMAGHR
jgi:hypothetical protein